MRRIEHDNVQFRPCNRVVIVGGTAPRPPLVGLPQEVFLAIARSVGVAVFRRKSSSRLSRQRKAS
jgi:hypothetical protein